MYRNVPVTVVFDERHDTQASCFVTEALASDDVRFRVTPVHEQIPAYARFGIPGDRLTRTRRRAEKPLVQSNRALPNTNVTLVLGHAGRDLYDHVSQHGKIV